MQANMQTNRWFACSPFYLSFCIFLSFEREDWQFAFSVACFLLFSRILFSFGVSGALRPFYISETFRDTFYSFVFSGCMSFCIFWLIYFCASFLRPFFSSVFFWNKHYSLPHKAKPSKKSATSFILELIFLVDSWLDKDVTDTGG